MKRAVLICAISILYAALVACSGTKADIKSTVTISPTSTSVKTGAQVQFTATVNNAASTSVSWSVNNALGGDLTNGTIDLNGLYTAPGTVPKKATVTVTATSLADVTQTASAQVTISAGTPIEVAVSPATASVPTGQTVQFTATVSNTAFSSVSWAVNNSIGGDAVNGSIDPSGLYTAPAAVPSTATVTIKAISLADTSKTATAQVTITPFKHITVSPPTVVVPAGGQQTFTGTIDGQNANATWSATCQSAAPGACGTINSAGVYTAPLSPPLGGDVTISATSSASDVHGGGAIATVQFSDGTLNGQYAFSFSGQNKTGFYLKAGSVTFDGAGNITGGTEDTNSGGFSTADITGGTYHIGTDGRGTATIQTANGTATWNIAVVNYAHGFAVRSEADSLTASGTLDRQDSTQFNAAAIQGNYALNLAGMNVGDPTASLALAGAVTCDGAGVIGQGELDVNNGSAGPLALTGAYTAPSSSGRGVLTIGSSFGNQSFSYYIVDATHLKLMQADAAQMLSGDLFKQPAGPFTAASFKGGFAFTLAGSAAGHPLAEGGVFALDAAGNLTSGAMDINNNGTLQTGLALSGSYSVTDQTTGRTTLSLTAGGSTFNYVFYPQAGGALNILQLDSGNIAAGAALPQGDSSFTVGSVNGKFAVSMTGTDFSSTPGELDIAGELNPNGGGALTGTVDINYSGTISSGTAVTGSYHIPSLNGRGTAALQTTVDSLKSAGFTLYLVNSGEALFLGSDSTRVLTGVMQKQY